MDIDEAREVLAPWIDAAKARNSEHWRDGLSGEFYSTHAHINQCQITWVPFYYTDDIQKNFPLIRGNPKPKLLQALMTYCAHIKGPDYFL